MKTIKAMKDFNYFIKNGFQIVLGLILILAITACGDNDNEDDDTIWDFANTSILIKVQSSLGADLLNPQLQGNITDNAIKAIYQNKEYIKDADKSLAQTRFNMPRWSGLSTYTKDGKYYLSFGEFSPTKNYKNEPFIIYWGDGTSDTISFDFYITWEKKKPTVHRAVYLNGKEASEITIIK